MKPFLKYGIITGIAICLWLMAAYFAINAFGISPLKSRALSGLFSIFILILGIFFGLREIKKKNNGHLVYKQAVLTGIKISVITAIIVSLYSLLYSTVINPEFPEMMIKETEKMLIADGMSSEEIVTKLSAVRQEFSTQMQVMQSLIGQSVIGTLASLIISLFIRTKSAS